MLHQLFVVFFKAFEILVLSLFGLFDSRVLVFEISFSYFMDNTKDVFVCSLQSILVQRLSRLGK